LGKIPLVLTFRIPNQNRWSVLLFAIFLLTAIEGSCFGGPSNAEPDLGKLVALPLAESGKAVTNSNTVE
jgi:hypothetical protein